MNDEHLKQKSWGERLEEAKKTHDREREEFEGDSHEESEDLGECNY